MIYHDNAGKTFRGLPLTPEQDSEIRHYLNRKERLDKPWDTPELQAMLDDMLLPPNIEDESQSDRQVVPSAAAERATSFIDQAMEPIEAYEEWHAAMESEGMKGSGH